MTRYWFKPKRYGYGATPATWEGWAFTGLVVAIVAVASSLLFRNGHPPNGTMALVWWAFFAIVVALTVVVAKFRTVELGGGDGDAIHRSVGHSYRTQ